MPVAEDGSYSAPFELTAGKWALKVTASGQGTKAVALTRNVTVAYKGVTVAVTVKGGRAWLKVWVDGKVSTVTGAAGKVYSAGKILTFTGATTSRSARATWRRPTSRSTASTSAACPSEGNPGTWLFAPPAAPERTDNR